MTQLAQFTFLSLSNKIKKNLKYLSQRVPNYNRNKLVLKFSHHVTNKSFDFWINEFYRKLPTNSDDSDPSQSLKNIFWDILNQRQALSMTSVTTSTIKRKW